MYLPDLYNSFEVQKLKNKQTKHAWDLSEIYKFEDIDFTKTFAPITKDFLHYEHLTPNERVVVGQFLGLVINSAICELELALERSKKECYFNVIERFPVSKEFESLGNNFFLEEKKHSDAFNYFLNTFAKKTNVEREELRSLLPILNESKIEKIFRINGTIGGQALWLVTAAVEEESIEVFKKMIPHKKVIDPFFYKLHHLHFQEEMRHASFAFLMLELLNDRSSFFVDRVSKVIDFILSDVLQVSWVLSELVKTSNVDKLKNHHPFYETLGNALPKISDFNLVELFNYLFKDSPFVSLILNPRSNKELSKFITSKNYLALR
ncbi:MAG: hypothetical protein CME61_02035 [Halobacteriovoraceae bacterium]|nr:hypothetical protein [Halobacteriovoraceae bacterium]